MNVKEFLDSAKSLYVLGYDHYSVCKLADRLGIRIIFTRSRDGTNTILWLDEYALQFCSDALPHALRQGILFQYLENRLTKLDKFAMRRYK